MSESSNIRPDPFAWFLKSGADEIGPLSEQELRRHLNKKSDRLASLRVRQGNSDWYPAQAVLDKFYLLAKEGIYVRHKGVVDGPFTAEKAMQLLKGFDLGGLDAKIGINGSWIPAVQLYDRLRAIKQGVGGASYAEDDAADASPTESSEPVGITPIDSAADEEDESIIMAQPVIKSRPSFEVILLAEPVATVSRPAVSPGIPQLPRQAVPLQSAHAGLIGRPQPRIQPKPDSTVFWVTGIGLVLLLALLVGGIAIRFRTNISSWLKAPDRVEVDSVDSPTPDETEVVAAPVDGPPPVVGRGTLFRPKFLTSIGEASGGTLFAARVGRSNRILLIGAAHLLGPATGLKRQLRGAEALIYWRELEVTDCVDGSQKPIRGAPLRLRTSEFPTKSVNGDSLAIQPEATRGFEPLPVADKLPNPGDRVWLLAPVRESEQLVHPGRWVGTDDGWLVYRLDHQTLDMVGTSGGAVVNVDHEAIGIHVAGGESDSGLMSIASPLELIVDEIR